MYSPRLTCLDCFVIDDPSLPQSDDGVGICPPANVLMRVNHDYQQRANILKEVQIMRQLDHPNIIKLVDFAESRQYYYIILELAPGGELFHQIVRLTYFSEDLSRHVITQVAKALEYLHEEKGVVHR